MHPEIEELSKTIQETADLLLSVGEQHWGNWLAKDAALIRRSDFRGVEHVLSAFGGMGSINDLIIHPVNGHAVNEAETSIVNEKLEVLLSSIAAKSKKLYDEQINALRGT